MLMILKARRLFSNWQYDEIFDSNKKSFRGKVTKMIHEKNISRFIHSNQLLVLMKYYQMNNNHLNTSLSIFSNKFKDLFKSCFKYII